MNPKYESLLVALLLCPSACGDDTGQDPTEGSTSVATPITTPGPGTTTVLPTTTMVDSGNTSTGMGTSSSTDGSGTSMMMDMGMADMPPFGETFDCDEVPDQLVSYELIEGPRGYHGLAISSEGLMIGSDGASLIQSTYDGQWEVFIPGIGNGQQMDWLLDGDLAHATDNGALTRIRSDGTTDIITGGVNAYGVIRGPDDLVYITSNGGLIQRIDPDTGNTQNLLNIPDGTAHGFDFNPAGDRIYVGTIGSGTVYYVDFDDNMMPISQPLPLTNSVGEGSSWHDAVAVDACGNLYIPDFWSSNIYRVRPNGDTSVYWQPPDSAFYAHGLVWGTGEDGWRIDAFYFPQPYNGNTVGEIVVGAPPRDFEGMVLNAPMPI